MKNIQTSSQSVAKLRTLGAKKTIYPTSPDKKILETFENKHPENLYLVPFKCNEFTSLCPKTGQPDFAKIEIVYAPKKFMVESKSLKLYLFSFRNSGEFHEDVVNRIMNDLREVLSPRYIRVIGDFNVRGGISIKPIVDRYDSKIIHIEIIQQLVTQWDRVKSNLGD